MDRRWKSTLIATTVLALFGTCTSAEIQWRLGANLGSYHIESTKKFNEFNPGAFISLTFNAENRLQYGVQFGGYINSYNDRTLYGSGFVKYRIKKDDAELFIGGFFGFFEYPNLIQYARSAGVPTIGNTTFIAGPMVTYRMESGVDLTLGYIPFRSRLTSGILTLQTSIPFGGVN